MMENKSSPACPTPCLLLLTAAAHNNWRRLANLNEVVYSVDNDYNVQYAGTSVTSGAMGSMISFFPSFSPPAPMMPPNLPLTVDGKIPGCMNKEAINYNPMATVESGDCQFKILG